MEVIQLLPIKTRRTYIPVGSTAASLLLTFLIDNSFLPPSDFFWLKLDSYFQNSLKLLSEIEK